MMRAALYRAAQNLIGALNEPGEAPRHQRSDHCLGSTVDHDHIWVDGTEFRWRSRSGEMQDRQIKDMKNLKPHQVMWGEFLCPLAGRFGVKRFGYHIKIKACSHGTWQHDLATSEMRLKQPLDDDVVAQATAVRHTQRQ
jgi:hypothetical protein